MFSLACSVIFQQTSRSVQRGNRVWCFRRSKLWVHDGTKYICTEFRWYQTLEVKLNTQKSNYYCSFHDRWWTHILSESVCKVKYSCKYKKIHTHILVERMQYLNKIVKSTGPHMIHPEMQYIWCMSTEVYSRNTKNCENTVTVWIFDCNKDRATGWYFTLTSNKSNRNLFPIRLPQKKEPSLVHEFIVFFVPCSFISNRRRLRVFAVCNELL